MNKYFEVQCPYCFKKLKYNNAVFRMNSGEKCTDLYLRNYHIENGNTAFERVDYGVVDPANLHKSQLEIDDEGYIIGVENPEVTSRLPLRQRLCPYCHNNLIPNFGRQNVKYIAVVGVPNSGKTTFLAAINDSLRKKSWNWNSLNAQANRPLDAVTELYSLNKQQARVATKSVQGPFIYRMNCSDKNDTKNSYDNQIVFFDVPGEFYSSSDSLSRSLSLFISKADGIVFIINAAESLEYSQAVKSGAQVSMISCNDILEAFEQTGLLKDKKVAIVFNKLDKVKKELGINDVDNFITNKTEKSVDLFHVKSRSDSIIDLMLAEKSDYQNDIQRTLSNYMRRIKQVFGEKNCVFATRLMVEDDSGFYFRSDGAETPLLWLLSEIGAFPKRKI